MARSTRIGLPASLLIALLVGCGEGAAPVDTQATVVAAVRATVEALPTSTPLPPPSPTPTSTPVSPPSVLETSASVTSDNPLIVELGVTLDRPAQVYVEYGNEDAGQFRTMTTEAAATEHLVPVVRLRPSATYSYQVFTVDSDGRESEGAGGTFTTGELPEALATIEFSAQGRPTPELLLLDHRDVGSSYIFVLDQDSNIVWYYASPNPIPGVPFGLQAIRQKPDYNLVYYVGNPPQPCCLREITPLGEVVDSLSYSDFDGIPHHDHLILPDNKVLYLAWTYRVIDDTEHGGDPETLVEGDSLRIWDQNTGVTYEIWNTFDALSTDVRMGWDPRPSAGLPDRPTLNSVAEPVRWTFANSLAIGPRGNYIVSLKRLAQVVSISPDLQTIEWTLGGPNSTFTFSDPTDLPYNFHTVSGLPNGNILVFDNGLGRPEEEGGEYSRVLELALSDYDLVATKVWEYRPDPDNYARLRSSAYRLDNGNTLVSFDTDPRVLVEVARDGTEVWKLVMTGPWLRGSYRAYAHESVMGETRIR